MRLIASSAIAIIAFVSCGQITAKPEPRLIRNKLFKYDILLNKKYDELYHNILKSIKFSKNSNVQIPEIALCSVKHTSLPSESDRHMFIKSIAAAINCVNKIIMEHREFIILVKNKKEALTPNEKDRFNMICSFYQTNNINELLERVAPVPVSVAVAQAALESGFGSSKHMHRRNAFFGMMRDAKNLYSFDTLFESAIAYAKTLNVNNCYKAFRKERAAMMRNAQKIDGKKLFNHLGMYYTSKLYKKQISALMKEYSLTSLDKAYKAA
jgi:Bax protein